MRMPSILLVLVTRDMKIRHRLAEKRLFLAHAVEGVLLMKAGSMTRWDMLRMVVQHWEAQSAYGASWPLGSVPDARRHRRCPRCPPPRADRSGLVVDLRRVSPCSAFPVVGCPSVPARKHGAGRPACAPRQTSGSTDPPRRRGVVVEGAVCHSASSGGTSAASRGDWTGYRPTVGGGVRPVSTGQDCYPFVTRPADVAEGRTAIRLVVVGVLSITPRFPRRRAGRCRPSPRDLRYGRA